MAGIDTIEQSDSLLTILAAESGVPKKISTLLSEATQAENKARELRKQAERYQETTAIIAALRTSWDHHDPGKDKLAAWFVCAGKRCIAKELLPEGTRIVATNDEWKKFLAEYARNKGKQDIWQLYQNGHPYGAVSPDWTVISLADVDHIECPKCHELRPLIQTYEQTEDGPDGDTWCRQRFVLCCEALWPIGEPQYSGGRF